jgi:putative intracellular protease/amidase
MRKSLGAFICLFTLLCLVLPLTPDGAIAAARLSPQGDTPAVGNAAPADSDANRRKVAILVFDGVQIIDYTGPYEVFGQANFDVFTVSKTGSTIKTTMGMSVNPRYDFAKCPKPDLIVVPGGDIDATRADGDVIRWIRMQAAGAEYVLSVCNGAFLLNATGMLDSLSATTFYGLLDDLKREAPTVEVVSDQRFVDNGKIVTSAGLSSGIDASLHIVSKIYGKGRAQQVALHMEYDWKPDSKFARADLADMHLRNVSKPEGFDWKLLSTEGDAGQWTMTYVIKTDLPAPDVLALIDDKLTGETGWTKVDTRKSKGLVESLWGFTDAQARQWQGESSIAHMGSESKNYLVTLRVMRGSR